jgi:hypothetical protein
MGRDAPISLNTRGGERIWAATLYREIAAIALNALSQKIRKQVAAANRFCRGAKPPCFYAKTFKRKKLA